jgi:long-chain fatty acid transport protein
MKKPILTLTSLAALAGGAWGAGYYLPNQDAAATAKGNAFVATADTAAAVHYNAAGLTQLEGIETQMGIYTIQLGTEAKIPGRGRYRNKAEWQTVPSLFAGGPLNDRFAWGVGLYSPFGMGNEWGFGTPFQTVVAETYLLQSTFTGALAYQINNCLSVGGSVSLNYEDLETVQALAPIPKVNFLRFKGDGFSVAAALSMLWQPGDRHSFGLSWSTETSTTLDGRIDSTVGAMNGKGKFDFMTPMRAAVGYSYRPSPGWNIEANVEWLDWDSLNTLSLRGPTVGTIPAVFNWQGTFIYEIGASYVTEDGWVFAAGYDYNENAQPDATYSPGVADADIQYFNVGMGRQMENWSWFLGYQFGYANRVVNGSVVGTNGKYESRHHAVSASVRYRF